MPASTPPRRQRGPARFLKVAFRHTVIHALNVLLYVFMAALALVAGLLIFLLSRDDIPLPDFVLRRIESRLAEVGLELSFSRARLDMHGGVLINDLQLVPARFGEPVLQARLVYLNFDELFLAAGMVELTDVRGEDVTLLCPSTLSPSGSPFPLARLAGFSVTRAGRAWKLDGLLAETGALHVAVRGTVALPPRRTDARPRLDPALWLDRFAEYAPRVARALTHLEGIEDPRIDIAFELNRNGEMSATVTASASEWIRPALGDARAIELHTDLHYANGRLAPFDVIARIDHVTRPDGLVAEHVAAQAHWSGLPDPKRPGPERIEASAARVVHPKVGLRSIALTAATASWPETDGVITFALAGEPIELRVTGDASARRGQAEVRGRFGRAWLAEASRISERDLTYYAQISQPPDLWARAELGDGTWKQAEFRALSGAIVARGVALDRARVHGVVTPTGAVLDHLEIEKDGHGGIGTYTDEFATREHRLLLRGSMRPLLIAPWFSGWWERFWDDFTFDGGPPEFDIDVSGSWNIRGSDIVHGHGRAANGSMRGIRYDALETRFFIRMDYYDLYQAVVTRPEGSVRGEVQLLFRPPQRDAARTSFRFQSNADLVELARAFGAGGEALLAPYRYTVPPTAVVSGVVTNDGGTFDTTLDVNIESTHEFRYHDFPVSSISTDVKIHNTRVEIPRLLAGYGGGTLRASAVAENEILSVKASLDNASYDDATRIFNEFLDRRSPPKPEEQDPAGLTARPPGGRLSLGVEATGPITTFDAYEGHGSLRISEANLGSVRIFGLLSDLMGSISPKLGSLRFGEANSTFQIQRDRVAFPDLRITGRTAALETEGTYYINSKNLDFRARLFPLGESGGAITQLFDFVLGPVSYLLEMRLTGTLRKPNWSLSRMPFAPKPVVDEGTPSTPASPAAASTGPEASPTPAEQAPTTQPAVEPPPPGDSAPEPTPPERPEASTGNPDTARPETASESNPTRAPGD